MPNPIKASWCLSDNVGDKLTPWLIKKITGQYPIYIEPQKYDGPQMLGPGSILNWNYIKNEKLIVWGSGIANMGDTIEKSDFRLVRGPICTTKIKTLYGLEIPFGDPGLIVSHFSNDSVSITHEVGVIPHYIDQYLILKKIEQENILFINVLAGVEEFTESIRRCKFIFSSSLHGLIFCDSYNIPNAWIKLSNNILGDDTKFLDYLSSVGRECSFLDCREDKFPFNKVKMYTDIYNCSNCKTKINVLKETIWRTCPFSTKELK
jgi:hypothetical protein